MSDGEAGEGGVQRRTNSRILRCWGKEASGMLARTGWNVGGSTTLSLGSLRLREGVGWACCWMVLMWGSSGGRVSSVYTLAASGVC